VCFFFFFFYIDVKFNSEPTITLYGRLFYVTTPALLYLEDCKFNTLKLEDSGSLNTQGLFFMNDANILIRNSVFNDINYTTSYIGLFGRSSDTPERVLVVSDSSFEGLRLSPGGAAAGSSGRSGGVFHVGGSNSLALRNVTLEKITLSSYQHGVIYLSGTSSSVEILNSKFIDINGVNNGGGIYVDSGGSRGVMVKWCIFERCKVDKTNGKSGGAIYIDGLALVSYDNTRFLENEGANGNDIGHGSDALRDAYIRDHFIHTCSSSQSSRIGFPTANNLDNLLSGAVFLFLFFFFFSFFFFFCCIHNIYYFWCSFQNVVLSK
jgi:hypothetical protein